MGAKHNPPALQAGCAAPVLSPSPQNLHGPEIMPDGTVRFRLWAPAVERVQLDISGEPQLLNMTSLGDGWHEAIARHTGNLYRFVLPDGLRVPDPASRFQPEDVHGPSEVVDTGAWIWSDTGWKGRPWREAVIYELHVGAFTPEGTFRAAIEKLDHLASLGITAVELMPVADFPGARNWGYDGVLTYAPDSSYGRPEDLKALVEAAHARGIMIFLDVVYNHFGPDGNYLHLYAPQFFTKRHKTPWGPAVNFDGPESRPVREFIIENALYWLRQFHVDGLRLDAVHAIADDAPTHILAELAERVHAAVPEREVHLILENEKNEPRWIERAGELRPRLYAAQWNDDLHHALHTAISGESAGYYADYLGDTRKLGRALAEGFAFQGEIMKYRGTPRGESSAHLPPEAFIAFLQNHDQIGNRAFGERISVLASPGAVRAAAAAYLLAPQIPMLFMGEEWGARSPFPFFSDFGPELAEAVRKGRREEFARFPEFRDPARREQIPDPQAPETFASAKLDWAEAEDPNGRAWLDWYRRILTVRRERIVPIIHRIRHGGEYHLFGKGAVAVSWTVEGGGELTLAANLSDASVVFPAPGGDLLWREGPAGEDAFGPWAVEWRVKRS